MANQHRFDMLAKAAKEEVSELASRFMEENGDLSSVIEREGVLIEYDRERDHLYVTVGERREGMALLVGHLVVLAQPETLEFLGFEIPDFRRVSQTGALQPLSRLFPFIEWQPIVHIPAAPHDDGVAFPREVAQGVQWEIAMV